MKQRIAIVTGSCRGIGYAIAEELSSKGMDLAMLDIDGDKLKAAALELKKKSSVEILPVVVDLSDAEMLKRACVDVRGKFGSVDTIEMCIRDRVYSTHDEAGLQLDAKDNAGGCV